MEPEQATRLTYTHNDTRKPYKILKNSNLGPLCFETIVQIIATLCMLLLKLFVP